MSANANSPKSKADGRRVECRVSSVEPHEKRRSMRARFLRGLLDTGAQGRAVEAWNMMNPVGTRVRVVLDDGSTKDTTTTAPAQLLGGHTAVAWLNGFDSCYLLERCRALRADEL